MFHLIRKLKNLSQLQRTMKKISASGITIEQAVQKLSYKVKQTNSVNQHLFA